MTDFFAMKWWKVGWQGITLSVPEEWNIGAIGGDRTQGYLRIDGPEMPRVEIKWADAGQKFVDIGSLVEKYLHDLQKGRKQERPEVERDIKVVSKRKLKSKKGLECFAWQGETQGFGAAWFCPDCHRTVIIQVMGMLEEPVRQLAERVILNLEDHAGEWVFWSTYGFACETPEDFSLSGQKLMAGLIALDFSRDSESFHVARWGMANVVLKSKSLKEWGEKELSKRLKKYAVADSALQLHGHEGLLLDGRSTLPQEKIGSFVQHVIGKDFADRVRAYLWHCPEENKIYYVEGVVDRQHVEVVKAVVERIECHGGEQGGED